MQEKNDTSRNFLIRTDALAHHLGINVQDLPDVTGIGRASLFCYRSGKRPVTAKALLKLEAAERAAGIGDDEPSPATPAIGAFVGALDDEFKAAREMPQRMEQVQIAELAARIGRMEELLQTILARLPQSEESSEGRGRRAR